MYYDSMWVFFIYAWVCVCVRVHVHVIYVTQYLFAECLESMAHSLELYVNILVLFTSFSPMLIHWMINYKIIGNEIATTTAWNNGNFEGNINTLAAKHLEFPSCCSEKISEKKGWNSKQLTHIRMKHFFQIPIHHKYRNLLRITDIWKRWKILQTL